MRFIPASLSCTIPYYFNQDCCNEDKTCLSAVFNFHDDKFWKSSGEHFLNKAFLKELIKMREKKHGHALTGIVIRVMPPATESGGGREGMRSLSH